jgi:hypothetical protein
VSVPVDAAVVVTRCILVIVSFWAYFLTRFTKFVIFFHVASLLSAGVLYSSSFVDFVSDISSKVLLKLVSLVAVSKNVFAVSVVRFVFSASLAFCDSVAFIVAILVSKIAFMFACFSVDNFVNSLDPCSVVISALSKLFAYVASFSIFFRSV